MTSVCLGRGLHLLLVAGPPGDQLPLAPLPHLQLLALDGLFRPRCHGPLSLKEEGPIIINSILSFYKAIDVKIRKKELFGARKVSTECS